MPPGQAAPATIGPKSSIFQSVGGFGKSIALYYLNPVSIAFQLVAWGFSRAEAKRLMEPVTTPVYGANGNLELHVGTFPFPRGLYEAVLRPDKLKTKKMQLFFNAMPPKDREAFEMSFVPIKYATLSSTLRKIVHDQMRKLRIRSFNKSILERRLSVHDIFDPFLVDAALHMDGSKSSPRTKEWVALYTVYRGISCANAKSANKRRECLKPREALVRRQSKLARSAVRSPGAP